MNILTSQNVTMQNNAFYNNGATGRTNQGQILVAGQAGGIFVTDWQTGQVYDLFTTGTVLQGNTVVDGGAGQFGFGTYLTGTDWIQFATTLTAGSSKNVVSPQFAALVFKKSVAVSQSPLRG